MVKTRLDHVCRLKRGKQRRGKERDWPLEERTEEAESNAPRRLVLE